MNSTLLCELLFCSLIMQFFVACDNGPPGLHGKPSLVAENSTSGTPDHQSMPSTDSDQAQVDGPVSEPEPEERDEAPEAPEPTTAETAMGSIDGEDDTGWSCGMVLACISDVMDHPPKGRKVTLHLRKRPKGPPHPNEATGHV